MASIPTFSSKSSAFATTLPAWFANIRIHSAAAKAVPACFLAAWFSLMRLPNSKLSAAFSSLNFFDSFTRDWSAIIFRIRSGKLVGMQSTSWHTTRRSSPLI
jgi:hypothetical protein